MVLEQTLPDGEGVARLKSKMLRMFTIGKINKYYVVSCYAEPKEFAKYKPLFERIIASFEHE
jgi:hypothetical protein